MKFVDVEQGSAEWLALRRKCIGASDIPVIMGISPFTTRYQLWKDKLGLEEIHVTRNMQYGKDNEENARNTFCIEHDIDLVPRVCLHSNDWALASLDGLSVDGNLACEIKCPGSEAHNLAANGKIPSYYIPQVQWQMFVTGLQQVYYYSWSHFSNHTIIVKRDDILISEMVKEGEKFLRLVRENEPPELCDRDYFERNDHEWTLKASEWFAVHNRLKMLEIKEEQLRGELIRLSGDINTMGAGVKLRRIPRKGNVEYKTIPELKGVDLEKYRKPDSITWRIAIA